MTLVQEAVSIMEQLPVKSQQVVVELLKMLSSYSESAVMPENDENGFKRTGKSEFALPADFDEHFDDLNGEIAAMFSGGNLCDPFDKILVAQAKTEKMTLITRDGLLAGYGEKCVMTI